MRSLSWTARQRVSLGIRPVSTAAQAPCYTSTSKPSSSSGGTAGRRRAPRPGHVGLAAATALTIGSCCTAAVYLGSRRPLSSSSRTLRCDESSAARSTGCDKNDDTAGDSKASGGILSSLQSVSASKIPSIDLPDLPSLSGLSSGLSSWTESFSKWKDKLGLLQDELTGEQGSLYSNLLEQGKSVKENPEIQWDATVRLGNDLSLVERGFLRARREAVKPAFCRLVGLSESEVHAEDVPLVAVAGSGGGYRAMVNTLGSISQAKESGIWDVVSYASAVSGSCWALNTLYSVGEGDIKQTIDHVKARIETPFLDPESLELLTTKPTSEYLLSGAVLKNNSKAGGLNIVDAYGTLVSGRLYVPTDLSKIANRHLKISSQRDYVDTGKHPMPIYCTIRHELPETKKQKIEEKREESKKGKTESQRKDAREAKDQLVKQGSWMWFEISPYEVGCDELGAWIPTWSLGRLFENGKSVERTPELSLTIMSGIFASAFCATLYSYYNEIRPVLAVAPFFSQIHKFAEENQVQLDSIHPFPPAELPNFMKGLKGKLSKTAPDTVSEIDTLGFMDAGANLNIPYVPLFRRDCDLIIALDASADSQDIWFTRAAEYAEKAQVKPRWPLVDSKALFPSEEHNSLSTSGQDKAVDQGPSAASKVDQAKAQEQSAAASNPPPRAAQPSNPQPPPVGSGPHSAGTDELSAGQDGIPARRSDGSDKPVPESQPTEPPLGKCNIWIGSTREEEAKSCRNDNPTVEDVARRDGIALAYIPLKGKLKVDPSDDADGKEPEDKDVADVWSTWRFEYSKKETERLVELARGNFRAGEEQLKTVILGLYERKKRQRLQGRSKSDRG